MAAITAALVNELRQRTGAGMMDCKKALVEANGDIGEAEVILPTGGTPRMSVFLVRFDGGQWQQTDWYYTSYGRAWIWNAQSGWTEIVSYIGRAREFFVNGDHTVEAWELRYPAGGAGQWVNLGSCATTDFWN